MDSNTPSERTITLRDIIITVKEYIFFLIKNWIYLLVFALLGAFIMGFAAYTAPTRYKATITFMVNSLQNNSNTSGISSLLGQLSPNNGSTLSTGKVISLSKSRKIINKLLLDSVILEQKKDLLANHLISTYAVNKKWKNRKLTEGFVFKSNCLDSFTMEDNKALLWLYDDLIEEGKLLSSSTSFSFDSGIYTNESLSPAPELSSLICKKLYKYLSEFHIEQATQQQQQTFNNLQYRADSIFSVLLEKEQLHARLSDRSQGFVLSENRVKLRILSREIEVLYAMYLEGIKSLEQARFSLKNSTPVFQIIDPPASPVKKIKPGIFMQSLKGFIIGLLIVSFSFITHKAYSDILNP